jgi:hypothetical protein
MLVAHNARLMASFSALAILSGRDVGDTIVTETRESIFIVMFVPGGRYLFLSIITSFMDRSTMFSTLSLSIHVRSHRSDFLADPSPIIPAMVHYAVGVPHKLSKNNKITQAWGKVLNGCYG